MSLVPSWLPIILLVNDLIPSFASRRLRSLFLMN